jgi:hypothetical protein
LTYYYTNEEEDVTTLFDQRVPELRTEASLHDRHPASHRSLQHENVLELVQKRLDENPQAARQRRETVDHPFGTMKTRMGATHFLIKTLPKVATEMALKRARLQHRASHQHRRCPLAHCCDEGTAAADTLSSAKQSLLP